ncbi:DEKNAAC103993 [Brettanomyces naardenensis]|uniref:DEKNAAC103993 n=1 Tax=Brettanomyces naardenensis TaxID=13370 RepID=A0A448YQI2_BRENA|nr:DEKNAAC103993 [Brettanomyces naardenensis]
MSEDLIKQFMGVSGALHDIAEQYLSRNNNDLTGALNDYYRDSAGREPTPAEDSHPKKSSSSGSKFRSMAEMRDHEDVEGDEESNFFTGGEKSGLQVENPENRGGAGDGGNKSPMNLVEDLLKKAEREADEPDPREPIQQPKQPKFEGAGYTLGSEENHVSSSKIEDPTAKSRRRIPEKVTRTITFWKEGFQVDDGKLYRYDDPENAEYLKQLNQGRAPLSLLKVEMFQDVDVHVIKKLDESYKPPKKSFTGFHGEGNRLGSPVPGEPIVVGEGETRVEVEKAIPEKKKEEDTKEEESGDTRIQIRLAEGGRLVERFNSSDPVSAVYEFVASKSDGTRPWSLAFAFPLKVIDDLKEKTIAEAGLGNSVLVQRWR